METSGIPTLSKGISGAAQDIGRISLRMLFIGITINMASYSISFGEEIHSPKLMDKQDDREFHAAISEAEKRLDTLIKMTESDSGFYFYAVGAPFRDKSKDYKFSEYVTQPLLNSWNKYEVEIVKKDCGGTYKDGEICGIDYNPLTCTQDNNEGKYVYSTYFDNKRTAIISYKWEKSHDTIATYRLVAANGVWAIDGVMCGVGVKFNM